MSDLKYIVLFDFECIVMYMARLLQYTKEKNKHPKPFSCKYGGEQTQDFFMNGPEGK